MTTWRKGRHTLEKQHEKKNLPFLISILREKIRYETRTDATNKRIRINKNPSKLKITVKIKIAQKEEKIRKII